ncbi:MAG: SGNH/GDSL hydrolase family protein [Betaproteobacteria bacterium]|nr:SGNH/GDSL hydrolase family protein [Betaproteobacteria bacterium]
MSRPTPWPYAARLLITCLLSSCLSGSLARANNPDVDAFELRDGDRVVLIGNTFIEREQTYSYFESLLRTRWPDRKITFRNLGWSGDTVFGRARGYEHGADKGFERLQSIVHELKPTVLFIGYGMGESFDGEAGLSSFREGLGQMLDMLKDLNARTVLIGPIRHENLGPPMPDPAEHNRLLRMYANTMADVSAKRGHRFVDLYELRSDSAGAPLTENGIHLTQYGYWRVVAAIAERLKLSPRAVTLTIGNSKQLLPLCPPPQGAPRKCLPGWERKMVMKDLAPGIYVLTANGDPVTTAPAEQWATGVEILDDPASRTVEKIRGLAVLKNIQYFNQWRPANEPYILGFRKAEQSRNRVELPRFTQPIEQLEAEIAKLARPAEIKYELKPQ